ncbi:MAG: class III lanthionine synthetase LanKC [Candidatus Eremiobacteraeota bacterium]|nr:class III lanthionine synthetase LanKC [Candidatus Eremiobacteraeota bacterium]
MRTRRNLLNTIAHPEFYETVDLYEVVVSDYIEKVRAKLPSAWDAERQGIWFYAQPRGYAIPPQGWKIHVSASAQTAEEIIEKAVPVLVADRVSFKIAADRRLLSFLTSKIMDRGSSGKFMTVYPRDEEHFRHLINLLDQATRGCRGPYILSDLRYKQSRVVFYRYGTMQRQEGLTSTGSRQSVLVAPNGELVEDRRAGFVALPPWVEDPFADEEDASADEEMTLNNGRYLIIGALGHSNTGGVYRAKDRANDDEIVIIKEARPGVGWISADDDAPRLLEKEFEILQQLHKTGYTARPIELFRDWEHTFIAQELITGVSLANHVTRTAPLLNGNLDERAIEEWYGILRRVYGSLIDAVQAIHDEGIILCDLSPMNVLWVEDRGQVKLIDFEAACRLGRDAVTFMATPGFAPGNAYRDGAYAADDLYALGALIFSAMMPISEIFDTNPEALERIITDVGREVRAPKALLRTLIGLLDLDRNKRPELSKVRDVVRHAAPDPANLPVPAEYSDLMLRRLMDKISGFVLSTATLERRDRLFPADFHLFSTNPLGLGYGASGVLAALSRAGVSVSSELVSWVVDRDIEHELYPPGWLSGMAGIAWAMLDLGQADFAHGLMRSAQTHPLLGRAPGLDAGAAGWGISCLRFFCASGDERYLAWAIAAAQGLLNRAEITSDADLYWPQADGIHYGLAFGASGVALFLLYLGLVSGDARYIEQGRRALNYDVRKLREVIPGVWSLGYGTMYDGIYVPYLSYGSSGVGAVTARYRYLAGHDDLDDVIQKLDRDTTRKYSVSPGMLQGLSGLGAYNLDLYQFTGDRRYRDRAVRTLDGVMLYAIEKPQGLAFPGNGLGRICCDYATGGAGILSFIHRLLTGAPSEYMLEQYLENGRPMIGET